MRHKWLCAQKNIFLTEVPCLGHLHHAVLYTAMVRLKYTRKEFFYKQELYT